MFLQRCPFLLNWASTIIQSCLKTKIVLKMCCRIIVNNFRFRVCNYNFIKFILNRIVVFFLKFLIKTVVADPKVDAQ